MGRTSANPFLLSSQFIKNPSKYKWIDSLCASRYFSCKELLANELTQGAAELVENQKEDALHQGAGKQLCIPRSGWWDQFQITSPKSVWDLVYTGLQAESTEA